MDLALRLYYDSPTGGTESFCRARGSFISNGGSFANSAREQDFLEGLAGDHAMPWARSRQKPLETAAVGYFRLPLGKHTARETRAIQQHSQAVLKCLWDHPNWPDPSTSFLW
eukprot:gene6930-17801_t